MKSVIDILDLSVDEVGELLDLAGDIIENPSKYAEVCHGKKLATLFFEPSTRTRLSFEAAMYELGGHVIGFSDANSSSATKGESVADTVKVISCYADIIAMRHTREGAPLVASCNATIPVINAGDGGHSHPTQTLADLLTIKREKGRLCDLTVGFCGDLKYGRTVHSLIEALSRYTGIRLVLISPEELKIPGYVRHEVIRKSGMPYVETTDLESSLPDLDILYMTRVQKERFADLAVYERLKDSYILTEEKMKLAKKDTIILHPLPRVNEISVKIDEDPRACYFKQVQNGKFIRMALILTLLRAAEGQERHPELPLYKRPDGDKLFVNRHKCRNPRCITVTEQELDQICRYADAKNNIWRCAYCEKKIRVEE
ncbi:MAG: aspartate carbamoyltransferase [Clostridia bacterium]|nr:aspartate carbamoyltransferase [Clostridia bacterium]